MSIGDIIYMGAALLFAYMTFVIIRGNFQRKFDEDGNRLDLKDKASDAHKDHAKEE